MGDRQVIGLSRAAIREACGASCGWGWWGLGLAGDGAGWGSDQGRLGEWVGLAGSLHDLPPPPASPPSTYWQDPGSSSLQLSSYLQCTDKGQP